MSDNWGAKLMLGAAHGINELFAKLCTHHMFKKTTDQGRTTYMFL